jgi:hypothetical protein
MMVESDEFCSLAVRMAGKIKIKDRKSEKREFTVKVLFFSDMGSSLRI